MEWTTEEEFLQITVEGKKEVFEEILTRVYNKAIESALCHTPLMVQKMAKKVELVNSASKKFFTDNPEYKDYIDIVLQTIQRTEIEFPGMIFEEIVKEAKPEIDRKIANIKKGV